MTRTCITCDLPIAQADDGTRFVTDTDTSADGLSFCPPDPDREPEGVHIPRAQVTEWLVRAHTEWGQS